MTHAPSGGEPSPRLDVGAHGSVHWQLYAAAAVAWLGFLLHNVADLPDPLLSPETVWPSLVTASLLAVHAAGLERVAGIGLMIWATLNLVGGALSVLPLPLLPFDAEQTLRHYSFHLLYAATQIPLLLVSWRLASRRPSPRSVRLMPPGIVSGGTAGAARCPDCGTASDLREASPSAV